MLPLFLLRRKRLAEELVGPKRYLAGFAGIVLTFGGLLVVGSCILVFVNNPVSWALVFAFPALIGIALIAYGIDVSKRGFGRGPTKQSMFEGKLRTARGIVGLIIALPILLLSALMGISLLATGNWMKRPDLLQAALGMMALFGFMTWKCAQAVLKRPVLLSQSKQKSDPWTEGPGDH